MTVERTIRIVAGLFIIVSLALGAPASPLFVSQWFLAFTAFVGANLFQFGFSNVCPLGSMLKKLGVPEHATADPLSRGAQAPDNAGSVPPIAARGLPHGRAHQ